MACATLFLLFMSQRSGSTWTCQVLDCQRERRHLRRTSTTSEMMIKYSHDYPGDGVPWAHTQKSMGIKVLLVFTPLD